ncbi:MAG: AraC family transcriptional regulator [Gammaproteobacteria bacterium]|nr:AraC family transcriptional regulator [Gammaproteobacteria bacterium]
MMKRLLFVLLTLVVLSGIHPGAGNEARAAAPAAPAENYKALDEEVQSLQQEILEVSRDLFMLEEELLFPATTQVSIFLSMDVGEFFRLDSVQLQIGGKEVANYLYTQREIDALKRGGVQRLYVGNLKLGDHELVAFFTGEGPHDRDYRRGANLNFKKGIGPKYIELKIVDLEKKQQPEFSISEWE